MNDDKSIDAALAAANPLPDEQLRELPLGDAERELMLAVRGATPPYEAESPRRRRALRLPRLVPRIATGAVALAAVAAAIVFATGGYGGSGTPAYGAGLVRLAKASPLVLLDQPGWRVESIGEPSARRGVMRFRKGSGAGGPSATLRWHPGSLDSLPQPQSRRPTVVMLALSVRAVVIIHGFEAGRSRKLVAAWEDHGRLLEFSSADVSLAEFEAQLNSLRRVGAGSWLDALPARIKTSRP